ncbi:tyrosine-type recombinase/integrase [Allobranchiibius huperziae]|nr:tyrosine-type recombinase/integrase [Allobranchiibius huperziae]
MMTGRKRGFGQISKQRSGRLQARYTGPDLQLHTAPHTFALRLDAEAWLADERRSIVADTWTPPANRRLAQLGPVIFATYARAWLIERDLKPRTRAHYTSLLQVQLQPLANTPLTAITPPLVRHWYSTLDPTRPTLRSHAYGLLRTILNTAVQDEEIAANPCHIRGAGSARRVKQITPATLNELEAIALAMPEHYRPLVLLAAWTGLRFGEITELRRKDIDVPNGTLHVRRGVVRSAGRTIVGSPKSAAGVRDVAIPPHLLPMLDAHLMRMAPGRDRLVFPAADGKSHLAPSTLYRVFYPARQAAGRTDLRWHDLRHTGAVLAA